MINSTSNKIPGLVCDADDTCWGRWQHMVTEQKPRSHLLSWLCHLLAEWSNLHVLKFSQFQSGTDDYINFKAVTRCKGSDAQKPHENSTSWHNC